MTSRSTNQASISCVQSRAGYPGSRANPSMSWKAMITTTATTTTRRTEAQSRSFRLFIAAVVSLCPALAACGGDNLLLPKDGEPAKISVETGDNQTAGVGQPLILPLSAKVTDPSGRAVQGAQVVFVPPPGGTVDPRDTIRTGPDGLATASYTLSTTAGDQII